MRPDFRVFIGWDSKEPVAAAVCAHSILTRASRPVSITFLRRDSLPWYQRARGATESTEFSLTRFGVPFESDFHGYSLFLDADVIVQADLWDILLYPLADPMRAVYCVQHDYTPKDAVKFDGHVQTVYLRKNWSSVLLFDNSRCTALTPAYINRATGLELHRFHWLEDDEIGTLPREWNHLVGEYEPNPDAKILHYTNGTPCFPGFDGCDQADVWWRELRDLVKPAQAVSAALETAVERAR